MSSTSTKAIVLAVLLLGAGIVAGSPVSADGDEADEAEEEWEERREEQEEEREERQEEREERDEDDEREQEKKQEETEDQERTERRPTQADDSDKRNEAEAEETIEEGAGAEDGHRSQQAVDDRSLDPEKPAGDREETERPANATDVVPDDGDAKMPDIDEADQQERRPMPDDTDREEDDGENEDHGPDHLEKDVLPRNGRPSSLVEEFSTEQAPTSAPVQAATSSESAGSPLLTMSTFLAMGGVGLVLWSRFT